MAVAVPERQGAFRELHSLLYPRNITEFSYRHNGSEIANIVVSFQALSGSKIEDDKMVIKNSFHKNGFTVTDLSMNEMAKSHARHLAGGRRELLLNEEVTSVECSSEEISSLTVKRNSEEEVHPNIEMSTFLSKSSSSISTSIYLSSTSPSLVNEIDTTDPELKIPEFKEFLYRFEFPESPGALNNFFCSINQFNEGSRSISLIHYRNHGHDYGSVLVGFLVRPNDLSNLLKFLDNIGYEHYDETMNSAYTQFLQ